MDELRGLIEFITDISEEDDQYVNEYLQINNIDHENFKETMLDYLKKKKEAAEGDGNGAMCE